MTHLRMMVIALMTSSTILGRLSLIRIDRPQGSLVSRITSIVQPRPEGRLT